MKNKVLLITLTFLLNTLLLFGQNHKSVVKDIEGNVYKTTQIGDQVWMAENLRVTKYNDGESIPYVTKQEIWESNNTKNSMMSWYENNSDNKEVYGGLYNWYVVNTNRVCPKGWHVPSDTEWEKMMNFISSHQQIGSKDSDGLWTEIGKYLKSASGWNENGNGTNDYGFMGLPAGLRSENTVFGVYFGLIGAQGYWWSSTSYNTDNALYRDLDCYNSFVNNYHANKAGALSIRCIQD